MRVHACFAREEITACAFDVSGEHIATTTLSGMLLWWHIGTRSGAGGASAALHTEKVELLWDTGRGPNPGVPLVA